MGKYLIQEWMVASKCWLDLKEFNSLDRAREFRDEFIGEGNKPRKGRIIQVVG